MASKKTKTDYTVSSTATDQTNNETVVVTETVHADSTHVVSKEDTETMSIQVPETKPGIVIELADAEQLFQLYKSVKSADAIYKSCQSTLFRNFTKSVYTAQNVENAFKKLESQIKVLKGE